MTSPLSFGYTLAVTLLWTVTNLALHVGLGIALALVLREPWVRMKGIWRALLILPWAVPNYITALIWKGMFHAQYGAINALLGPRPGPAASPSSSTGSVPSPRPSARTSRPTPGSGSPS